MRRHNQFRRILVLGCAFALVTAVAGCGTEERNRAPVANAGGDQQVTVEATVRLDGSPSSDPDGDVLTFKWTLSAIPDGSVAKLDDDTTAKPTFVADTAGSYQARLVVNDGELSSKSEVVAITAKDPDAPVAEAGQDREVTVGLEVELDGSQSTVDASASISYQWALESKPEESTAELDTADAEMPKFTADKLGDYLVKLVVGDGEHDSDADAVTITAVERTKPVATAGDDRDVTLADEVTLDGSASTVSPGLSPIYAWSLESKPDGSAAELDDATAAAPKFTADVEGDYEVQLIVNDGTEDSDPATVTITATTAL